MKAGQAALSSPGAGASGRAAGGPPMLQAVVRWEPAPDLPTSAVLVRSHSLSYANPSPFYYSVITFGVETPLCWYH